ncbi:putative sulfate exporter family transporter [Cellulomonas denverensis]|uniref:Putative sulfate exporter family transporter n=1 Tax=Cellulomonas denverensis TaxID=264297 RepID=A0A7X6R0B2_9CELL|nr:putative sulfate exporter family transporter [Cellulomonas denverensis]NKY23992.1 putative sulfate exporter family transporter [Cellulomonas denverensis]
MHASRARKGAFVHSRRGADAQGGTRAARGLETRDARGFGPGAARVLPGVLAALAVSGVCVGISLAAPAAPALLIAIVLGAVARAAGWLPAALEPGLTWTARYILRAGVVLLGLQLSVGDVLDLGLGELVVLLVTVATTFGVTLWLGRLLRVRRAVTLLVATGFSICGAAAVAGMSPVADAEEEDVATAVALVTVYGSLAIVALPLLSRVLGLDQRTAGLWAGMSVHEVAQVVAAAGTVGAAALTVAVVAKLARVVLLAPMVAGVGMVRRRTSDTVGGRTAPLVPGFVIGFVLAVLLRTVGAVPEAAIGLVKPVTTLALGAAMVALGTQIHLGRLIRTGGRPLLLGGLATLVAGGVSLAGLSLL